MIRWFRGVAVVEALSYLVLLAASVAKHGFGMRGLVETIGPIHGVIFLVYLALALAVRRRLGWDSATTLTVVIAAVIPLGGIVVERRYTDEPVLREPERSTEPA
jgi:integral membrane protein